MGQFVGIQVPIRTFPTVVRRKTSKEEVNKVDLLRCCVSFEVSKCEIEHVIHGKTERLPLLDKNSDGTVPKPLFPVAKILSGVQSLGIS